MQNIEKLCLYQKWLFYLVKRAIFYQNENQPTLTKLEIIPFSNFVGLPKSLTLIHFVQ